MLETCLALNSIAMYLDLREGGTEAMEMETVAANEMERRVTQTVAATMEN